MWQANFIRDEIQRVRPNQPVELIGVSTRGDRDRVEPLSQMGGVGVFTREVQRAVLDKEADLAVHSLKDLPTQLVDGLSLAGVPDRAPRFDALILAEERKGDLSTLLKGARIGTGSLRRQAQLLHVRPDLQMMEIRGNVDTRLRKLDEGEYDAIILAEAGLRRLGLERRISSVLGPPTMFPAVGQAALGIECREDDTFVQEILLELSDGDTKAEVLAERSLLRTLRAGCHAPVGTLTKITDDNLRIDGVVLGPDGVQKYHAQCDGPIAQAEELGQQCADELVQLGAGKLLEQH
ncbi:MAG: hydroxymethylbilane synthase [Planctomycetaceae bacterium]|nr:hydroxymethylbilane synthase [Planctomycetaceae bacterium]